MSEQTLVLEKIPTTITNPRSFTSREWCGCLGYMQGVVLCNPLNGDYIYLIDEVEHANNKLADNEYNIHPEWAILEWIEFHRSNGLTHYAKFCGLNGPSIHDEWVVI
jgi:hypothetical protein